MMKYPRLRRQRRKTNRRVYQVGDSLSTQVPSGPVMERLGAWVGQQPTPSLWLLQGPLGAGKTTFVRGALRSLGVKKSIASPTFTLAKKYTLLKKRWRVVLHLDGYRLRHQRELPALELTESFANPETLVLIEWPERFHIRNWPKAMTISIAVAGHGRRVTIRPWVGGQWPGAGRSRPRRSSLRR